MRRLRPFAAALATGFLMASVAGAAEIEGVEFADQLRVDAVDLELQGTGLLRHRFFIKVYVAALYLKAGLEGAATPSSVLADVPRRMEIEYFWRIGAEDFAKITREGIRASVDEATYTRLLPRIERMAGLYRDVEPGDRYSLTYLPGIGTELAWNGEPRGRIEGAGFSAALFSLWIGERALDESLRDQLLSTE